MIEVSLLIVSALTLGLLIYQFIYIKSIIEFQDIMSSRLTTMLHNLNVIHRSSATINAPVNHDMEKFKREAKPKVFKSNLRRAIGKENFEKLSPANKYMLLQMEKQTYLLEKTCK